MYKENALDIKNIWRTKPGFCSLYFIKKSEVETFPDLESVNIANDIDSFYPLYLNSLTPSINDWNELLVKRSQIQFEETPKRDENGEYFEIKLSFSFYRDQWNKRGELTMYLDYNEMLFVIKDKNYNCRIIGTLERGADCYITQTINRDKNEFVAEVKWVSRHRCFYAM